MKILLEFGGISHLHGSAVGKGGENGELAPDAGRGFREDDDPIRHADGFGDIVGDQKRGFPFFTQDLPEDVYKRQIYDDSTKYFNIVMTNPAFSYDRDTNVISVDPGTEPEQDGEMIITWKNQEGTFNTQPLTIKSRLHWDNLRDGYYIAFDSQGGSRCV